jgi:hypothetical protein
MRDAFEPNLILIRNNRLACQSGFRASQMHSYLLTRRPFHRVSMGVERTAREPESPRWSALLGAFLVTVSDDYHMQS